MKTLLPTFFLLLIFSSPVICQTSLTGKVTDGETGEELIASNVTLYRNGVLITGATTDFEGNYSINLDPGTYRVEVSYIGYASSTYSGVIVAAGMTSKLDMRLGGTGGKWQKRNNVKRGKRDGYEFKRPEGDDVIKEVLNNEPKVDTAKENYPTALVDFSDFKNLVSEIEAYRKQRLVSLDSFLSMSKEANTIILDTRAKHRYDRLGRQFHLLIFHRFFLFCIYL